MKLTLQRKAALLVSGVLLGSLGLNTLVLTWIAYRSYQRQNDAVISRVSAEGEGLSEEISHVLELGIDIGDMPGLSEKLTGVAEQDPVVSHVLITAPTGGILHASEDAPKGAAGINGAELSSEQEPIVVSRHDSYHVVFRLRNAEREVQGLLILAVAAPVVGEDLRLLLWAAGLVALFCFAAGVTATSWGMWRVIARPIVKIRDVASLMAAGRLDAAVEVEGEDELAALGSAVNQIGDNLRDVLARMHVLTRGLSGLTELMHDTSSRVQELVQMQEAAVERQSEGAEELQAALASVDKNVEGLRSSAAEAAAQGGSLRGTAAKNAEAAKDVAEISGDAASAVLQVAAAFVESARRLELLSESSAQTADAVEQVNITIEQIKERAEQSVQLAERVSEFASEHGLDAITRAVDGMQNIRGSVSSLSETVNALSDRSGQIDRIVSVIAEVADQTSLLALNASILAAQAGEQGRAFSVVADEIKSLAQRTAKSTKEINDLIASVQEQTQSSVTMARRGFVAVEEGMRLFDDVRDALGSIQNSAVESTGMARAIKEQTNRGAEVTARMTKMVADTRAQIQHISTATSEQSQGSSHVVDATEKMRQMSREMKEATDTQLESAERVSAIAIDITDQADSISKAINEQKTGQERVSSAIEQAATTVRELDGLLAQVTSHLSELNHDTKALDVEMQRFKV